MFVELSLGAIESANALRITFRRGCPVLEVGLDVDGAGDLTRFWVSQQSEVSIVAIQGSFKHSAAVGRLLGSFYIIRSMRRSAGFLLIETLFPRSKEACEETS